MDVRLVAPESRYEIDEGRLIHVPPADEPHGSRHSKVSALLEAYVAEDWDVASDMLTRTSETSDVAPDASVFPRARDPQTGGRQIEELAFEVASTERLNDAGAKARKLVGRGVRRVFAIDVPRRRAFEWSGNLGTWEILKPASFIEDRVLVTGLPVEALVHAAKADDAVARALLAKRNRVVEAALLESRERGKAEGKAEAVLAVLRARGLKPTESERARIVGLRDDASLDVYLTRALTCASVADVIES